VVESVVGIIFSLVSVLLGYRLKDNNGRNSNNNNNNKVSNLATTPTTTTTAATTTTTTTTATRASFSSGVNFTKRFFFVSLTEGQNKLERLSLASFYSFV
jgi:hypothetical protein